MTLLHLYIETNLLSIVLLLIILFNLKTSFRPSLDDILFKLVLIFNIMVLLVDTVGWIFDGNVFYGSLLPNKLAYALYFILTALFVLVWTLYALYKIYPNSSYLLSFGIWLSIPILILCVLSITSIWDGGLFLFDENGNYERGNLFVVHTVILWFYIICTSFCALLLRFSQRKRENRREYTAVALFALVPLAGAILQTFHYGLNITWTGSSLSLLFVFISIQNKQIITDPLTGIYNRGHFSQFLYNSLNSKTVDKNLFLILLDINNFKKINDTYGHNAGDNALREVSGAISKVCSSAKGLHFPARYGGDEFVILCKCQNSELLQLFVDSINHEIENINLLQLFPFRLSVSMGWAQYNPLAHNKPEDLIADADAAMYMNKQRVKHDDL